MRQVSVGAINIPFVEPKSHYILLDLLDESWKQPNFSISYLHRKPSHWKIASFFNSSLFICFKVVPLSSDKFSYSFSYFNVEISEERKSQSKDSSRITCRHFFSLYQK